MLMDYVGENCFPLEMWTSVFSNLDKHALNSTAKVCRFWKEISINLINQSNCREALNFIAVISSKYELKNDFDVTAKVLKIFNKPPAGYLEEWSRLVACRAAIVGSLKEFPSDGLNPELFKEQEKNFHAMVNGYVLPSWKPKNEWLAKEGFPIDKIPPHLLEEAISLSIKNKDGGEIIATMLLARAISHQLEPDKPAWQEMEALVDNIQKYRIIWKAFDACLKHTYQIDEFAYCFLVLLKMFLKIEVELPTLDNCAKISDQFQRNCEPILGFFVYRLFRDGMEDIDFTLTPVRDKLRAFLVDGLGLDGAARWAARRGWKDLLIGILPNNWKNYLDLAESAKNLEILEFIISQSKTELRVSLPIMRSVVKRKDLEMVKFLIGNYSIKPYYFMPIAAEEGCMPIFEYLVSIKAKNMYAGSWNDLFSKAAIGGNLELFKLAENMASEDGAFCFPYNWEFEDWAYRSASGGHFELLKYLLHLGKNCIDFHKVAEGAATIEILTYCMSTKSDVPWDLEKLAEESYLNEHLEVFLYLLPMLPDNFQPTYWMHMHRPSHYFNNKLPASFKAKFQGL